MHPNGVGTWTGDWAWSLPLIVLTVVIHVCGLAIIGERVVDGLGEAVDRRRFMFKFAVVMAVTSLLATILHGTRGCHLGGGVPISGRTAGRPNRDALLDQRDDQLTATPICS